MPGASPVLLPKQSFEACVPHATSMVPGRSPHRISDLEGVGVTGICGEALKGHQRDRPGGTPLRMQARYQPGNPQPHQSGWREQPRGPTEPQTLHSQGKPCLATAVQHEAENVSTSGYGVSKFRGWARLCPVSQGVGDITLQIPACPAPEPGLTLQSH